MRRFPTTRRIGFQILKKMKMKKRIYLSAIVAGLMPCALPIQMINIKNLTQLLLRLQINFILFSEKYQFVGNI